MKTYIIKYHPIHDNKVEDAVFTSEISGAYSEEDALNKLNRIMSAYNLEGKLISIEEKTPLTSL